MSGARKVRRQAPTADERQREHLATLRAKLQLANERAIAQQTEIEQMRAALIEASAPKMARPFRARKLIHGPLDVTIKGVDVLESEVVIEHVGGYLAIRIGDAIGSPLGVQPREAYNFTPNTPPAAQLPDIQASLMRDVGVTNLAGFDAHGLGNGDPTVVNVALAPQNPRGAGYQLRDDETQIVAAQYGWSGVGPKPPGWRDPDATPPQETAH